MSKEVRNREGYEESTLEGRALNTDLQPISLDCIIDP